MHCDKVLMRLQMDGIKDYQRSPSEPSGNRVFLVHGPNVSTPIFLADCLINGISGNVSSNHRNGCPSVLDSPPPLP